jgi:hypothetical protein
LITNTICMKYVCALISLDPLIVLHNTILDFDMVHNIIMDLDFVDNTFVDLDLVHNIFHILPCITHQ